ncbi:MAG TPA: hypothetical protein ENH13_03525 [Euryarchaeota archaeon]|nr:hypothetical protein [Euryarchaeota archaeon]
MSFVDALVKFLKDKTGLILMTKDVSDVGEERIRAEMELNKIIIAATVGIVFTLMVGVILAFKIEDMAIRGGTWLLTVFAFRITWTRLGKPNIERYRQFADELDRRNAEKEKKYE